MAMFRSDALKADRTSIFVLRESPTLLQRYSGAATRKISAMTSAEKPKCYLRSVKKAQRTEVLTDKTREYR
jgi:hypothetical protein